MGCLKVVERLLGMTLASALFLGLSVGALAADVPEPGTGEVELIMPIIPFSLTAKLDGWRETRNRPGIQTEERVGGWSTLTDAAGGEVYHKTTAQYENFLSGEAIGSQSQWGYGKVYAYSDYVWYHGVADACKAKVYYDY